MNLCGENCGWCGACQSECPVCNRDHEPPECDEYEDLCVACGRQDCQCAYWQTCAICLRWNCMCDMDRDVTWDDCYGPDVTLPDQESTG